MLFDIEVKISLKSGMLNPEATTIERSLELLGYEVKNVKTVETIKFQMEGEDREAIRENVWLVVNRSDSNENWCNQISGNQL